MHIPKVFGFSRDKAELLRDSLFQIRMDIHCQAYPLVYFISNSTFSLEPKVHPELFPA
jgi:hypothetical protein